MAHSSYDAENDPFNHGYIHPTRIIKFSEATLEEIEAHYKESTKRLDCEK